MHVEAVTDACRRALAEADVALRDALLVAGGRWRSLVCTDPLCCPAEGTPVDDGRESPLAPEVVVRGGTILPDRESAVRALGPPAAVEAEPVRARIRARAQTGVAQGPGAGQDGAERGVAGLRLFAETVDRYADPRVELSDDDVAALAVAAHDTAVRDEVAMWATGPRGSQLRNLLADTVRRLPGPEDADVAVMLALVAYQQGDGMVARTATDRALASDPGCRLAGLLEAALDAGVPPSALTEVRTRARLDAHRNGSSSAAPRGRA